MDSKMIQPFILPAVGIALGLVVLLYLKGQAEKLAVGLGLADSPELKQASEDAIKDLPVDESKLSFKKPEYLVMKDRLLRAFEGGGTDEHEVFSVLGSLKNKHDWNYLQKIFGTPDSTNLRGWITRELDNIALGKGDLDVARTILNNLDIKRWEVITNNTFPNRDTITGWLKTKGIITPAVTFQNKKKIGILISHVSFPNASGKGSTVYSFIKTPQGSYYYVLRSQVNYSEY